MPEPSPTPLGMVFSSHAQLLWVVCFGWSSFEVPADPPVSVASFLGSGSKGADRAIDLRLGQDNRFARLGKDQLGELLTPTSQRISGIGENPRPLERRHPAGSGKRLMRRSGGFIERGAIGQRHARNFTSIKRVLHRQGRMRFHVL